MFELADNFNVPTVSSFPVVAPLLKVPPLKTRFDVFAILLAPPNAKIPDEIVVVPEYVFAPERVHVPVPDLVTAPVVVVIAPLSTPAPVPVRTRLLVLPVIPPLRFMAPLPDASIVAPLLVRLMTRLVEWPVPLYRRVPVPATEIVGAAPPVPSELLVPAFCNVFTSNIPLLMVTAPVNVFAADK